MSVPISFPPMPLQTLFTLLRTPDHLLGVRQGGLLGCIKVVVGSAASLCCSPQEWLAWLFRVNQGQECSLRQCCSNAYWRYIVHPPSHAACGAWALPRYYSVSLQFNSEFTNWKDVFCIGFHIAPCQLMHLRYIKLRDATRFGILLSPATGCLPRT